LEREEKSGKFFFSSSLVQIRKQLLVHSGEKPFFFFGNTFGRASPKIDGETSPTEGPGPYMHAHAAKGLAS
jgi:hypothetical protein